MPYAIKVTEETIPNINRIADSCSMNLDHLSDEVEYYAENGDVLYLIKDGKIQDNNITFTTMIADDFFRNWNFIGPMNTTEFAEIERV